MVSDVLDGQQWHVHHGDCIEHMATLPDACFDMSVFSPPFPSLYAYTAENSDIGNSEDESEAKVHLSFFYRQLARLVKPGRVVMVHVAQIPRMKRTGGRGMHDFRGLNIRLAERAGLVFEYDWAVRKNPQSQAIRSKSRELQFAGLESDRAKSRGAMPDYLLKFTAPGENAVPVCDWEIEVDTDGDKIGEEKQIHETQVMRNDWIEWAECTWHNIRETDTLNIRGTKGEGDTKHICPLQLPVIDRLVRLYTNPGEIVFSPFAGIGSEGVASVRRGRRFYGCELKLEYYETALRNIGVAEGHRHDNSASLLDLVSEPA
jgi:DNA modification methylase